MFCSLKSPWIIPVKKKANMLHVYYTDTSTCGHGVPDEFVVKQYSSVSI